MPRKLTNLNEIVRSWAWSTFLTSQGPHDFTNFDLEVGWDHVSFKNGSPTYIFANQTYQQQPEVRIFSLNYDNQTDEAQLHTISTNRSTSATAEVELRRGFRRDADVGITVPVPDDVVNSSFNNVFIVDNDEMNRIENLLSWTINSEITAPPNQKTRVEVKVVEKKMRYRFRTNVLISGRVLVNIADKKARDVVIVENDIATVIGDVIDSGKMYIPECVWVAGKVVNWSVIGRAKIRYGVSLKTEVTQSQIP